MDEFIHQKNLELFRRKLAEACSDEERCMVFTLLAEEESRVFAPETKDRRE
jgi:hypothetical protein